MPSQFNPFDRETTLDLVVNAIPLGIMLFFVGVFLFINPFGSDPVATTIQLTIVVVTFFALAILSYVSGKAISSSEKELEAMEAEAVSEAVGATDDAEDSENEPAGELESGTEETEPTESEVREADEPNTAET